jgi:hypothetical protein
VHGDFESGVNRKTHSPLLFTELIMTTEELIGGPAKDEFLNRVLAHHPVTFLISGGSVEILIDEFQDIDRSGDRLEFTGQIVSDGHMGARVEGQYDWLSKDGTLVIRINGA